MHHVAAADTGAGLANNTYNTATPIVVGQDRFVPSDNVTITVADNAAGQKVITGTYAGVGGSYAYNTATGAYIKTGAAYQ
jgi:hypothetical protein